MDERLTYIAFRPTGSCGWEEDGFIADGRIVMVDRKRRLRAAVRLVPAKSLADLSAAEWQHIRLPNAIDSGAMHAPVVLKMPPTVYLVAQSEPERLAELHARTRGIRLTEAIYIVEFARRRITIELVRSVGDRTSPKTESTPVSHPFLETLVRHFDRVGDWPMMSTTHRRAAFETVRRFLRVRWVDRRVPSDFTWVPSGSTPGHFRVQHRSGLTLTLTEHQTTDNAPGPLEVRVDGLSIRLPAVGRTLPIGIVRSLVEELVDPRRRRPVLLTFLQSGREFET